METEREAQTLRMAGCDELQGFLFTQALPAASLVSWMRERRSATAEATSSSAATTIETIS